MKELEERIIQFLKIAKKHNLCFKRLKCDIKAIKEWKTPTKVKDIESFLEFANFYQRFIQNFSYMVRLLNKLKGKKEWM